MKFLVPSHPCQHCYYHFYYYSSGYAVLSHCDFNLHLTGGIGCFYVLITHLDVFFDDHHSSSNW